MNREQMEAIWKGPIVNAFKKNHWKVAVGKTYEQEMTVYQKVLVSSYTKKGFYKNEKEARVDLESKLRAELYLEFKEPWKERIEWQFGCVREAVPSS